MEFATPPSPKRQRPSGKEEAEPDEQTLLSFEKLRYKVPTRAHVIKAINSCLWAHFNGVEMRFSLQPDGAFVKNLRLNMGTDDVLIPTAAQITKLTAGLSDAPWIITREVHDCALTGNFIVRPVFDLH